MAEYVNEREREILVPQRRVAWGAVFAGMVVVLVMQLVFSLLGLSIGAGSFDALTERNPAQGLAVGTGVWFAVTAFLSLFAGGWVAGRLAATRNNVDSALHGVVTWGLATLVSAVLITTAAGRVISGSAGLLGKVVGAAGQGIASASSGVTSAVKQELGIDESPLVALRDEAKKVLVQTRKTELQPRTLERRARGVVDGTKEAAGDVARNPQMADTEVDTLLSRIFARGKTTLAAADREALVNVLAARTEMSRPEAEQTVDRWQVALNDVGARLQRAGREAEQKAREVADATARGVSKAAAWTFGALLLGFLAAAFGGYLGAPDRRAPLGRRRPLYASAA